MGKVATFSGKRRDAAGAACSVGRGGGSDAGPRVPTRVQQAGSQCTQILSEGRIRDNQTAGATHWNTSSAIFEGRRI